MDWLRVRPSMLVAAVGVLLVVVGVLVMDPDTRSYISCLELQSMGFMILCTEPAAGLGPALILGVGAIIAYLGAGLSLFRR